MGKMASIYVIERMISSMTKQLDNYCRFYRFIDVNDNEVMLPKMGLLRKVYENSKEKLLPTDTLRVIVRINKRGLCDVYSVQAKR